MQDLRFLAPGAAVNKPHAAEFRIGDCVTWPAGRGVRIKATLAEIRQDGSMVATSLFTVHDDARRVMNWLQSRYVIKPGEVRYLTRSNGD